MLKQCYDLIFKRRISEVIILVYLFLLFVLPDDAYRETAVFSFTTPTFNLYKWHDFYVSWLMFPMMIAGFFFYYSKRKRMQTNILSFIVAIFVKDLICFSLGNSFILKNNSWEMYWLYIAGACMLFCFFSFIKDMEDIKTLWFIFAMLTLLLLFMSIALGITPGRYDYINRYTSTNLAHGETGFILAITIVLFLSMDIEYKPFIIGALLLGVVATGSRKDILYIILIVFIRFIIQFVDGTNPIIKHTNAEKQRKKRNYKIKRVTAISVALIPVLLIAIIATWNKISSVLNLSRVISLINIYKGASTFIESDYSGAGRIRALSIGLKVLREHPFLGLNFSFYNEQYVMQNNGFPTFPHNTIVFVWIIMGGLAIVPICILIKAVWILFKNRDDMMYVGIYYIFYHTISGGMWSSYKCVFINFFLIWMFIFATKKYGGIRIRIKRRRQRRTA